MSGVTMMVEKKVAGTVILHLKDGSKKFLTQIIVDHDTLTHTELSDQKTGLATILQVLKEEVQLDINNIHLLELTNGQLEDQNVPLFVFETLEDQQSLELPNRYHWVSAQDFRQILEKMNIEGVPFF